MNEEQVKGFVDDLSQIDVATQLWENREFDFVTKALNEFGVMKEHLKQKQALEILTSNKYEEFLYGGAAGGAKSWTGCVWIMFMAIQYPETKYFVARNELKDILESVLVTWTKVAKLYGFTDWKYNAQKNFIILGNGSHINFIELKYKPSDKMFEDVGSTEYTCGWIEEVGEIHPVGAEVISSRVGRHMNAKYGIKGIVLYTCNPKKNWAKTLFYDAAKKGQLKPHRMYLQCLLTENPFIEQEYVEKMRRMAETNVSLYQRLFLGNWEYEDSPDVLCDYEMIEQVWDNDHVPLSPIHYLTADVARYGSDKAVVIVWQGWRAIDMRTLDISKTTEIDNLILIMRRKYGIPKNRCLADADGVGGGVVDGSGILGFTNNGKAIKEKGKDQNFVNIKTQCMYKLADRINAGSVWLKLDLSVDNKQIIMDELDQIRSNNKDDRKLHCKGKDDIRKDIGRSPDYMDAIMMRVFFDLKQVKRKGLGSRPRG